MGKTALRLVASADNAFVGAGNAPANIDAVSIGHGFHYWEGETGARYLHSVYDLLDCPELPKVNYIIVERLANNACIPLYIGQTREDACSLNLAHIRQMAARLGGHEIHIHVMTDSPTERKEVERDLLSGQYKRLENKLRAQAANNFLEKGHKLSS